MPHSRLPPLRCRAGSRGGPGVATRRCPGARPEGRKIGAACPSSVGFDSAAAAAGHRLRAAHARSQSRMVGDVKGTRSRRRWSRGFRRPACSGSPVRPRRRRSRRSRCRRSRRSRPVRARCLCYRSARRRQRPGRGCADARLTFARRRMASRTRPGEEDPPRSVWRARHPLGLLWWEISKAARGTVPGTYARDTRCCNRW